MSNKRRTEIANHQSAQMPKEAGPGHQHGYTKRQEDRRYPRRNVVGAYRERGIHSEGFYRLDT